MAKVDWITWKTNPKEIIDPEIINEEISKNIMNFDSFIKSNIYQDLKIEVEKGGLKEDSLNLNGTSPVNMSANKILAKIDNIINNTEKLKSSIYTQALNQKELEKSQLIDAIEGKIREQKSILENTENLKNRLAGSNDVVSMEEIEKTLNATNEKIKMLTEKLEEARAI